MEHIDRIAEYIENPFLVKIGSSDPSWKVSIIDAYIRKLHLNALIVESNSQVLDKIKLSYEGRSDNVIFDDSDILSTSKKENSDAPAEIASESSKSVKFQNILTKHNIVYIDVLYVNFLNCAHEIVSQFNFERFHPYFIAIKIQEINLPKPMVILENVLKELKSVFDTHGYNISLSQDQTCVYARCPIDLRGSESFFSPRKNQYNQSIIRQRDLKSPLEKFELRKTLTPISINNFIPFDVTSNNFLIIRGDSIYDELREHFEPEMPVIVLSMIKTTEAVGSEIEFFGYVSRHNKFDDKTLTHVMSSCPSYVKEKNGIFSGHKREWKRVFDERVKIQNENWSIEKIGEIEECNRVAACDDLLEEIRLGKIQTDGNHLINLLFIAYLGFWHTDGLKQRASEIAKILHFLNQYYHVNLSEQIWQQLQFSEVVKDVGDYLEECEKFYDFHSILPCL